MISEHLVLEHINFLDVSKKRWIHGALKQLLTVVMVDSGEETWHDCETTPMPPHECAIRCDVFIERPGFLVMPLEVVQFNDAAHKRLTAQLDQEESRIMRLQ